MQKIYARRFTPDLDFRAGMWGILCREFFQSYVDRNGRVLEIGAGYCEFINNIRAASKVAVDINPDLRLYAGPDIEIVVSSASRMEPIPDNSVNVVFASNFFEHLERNEIVSTFREVHRILVPGGRFMVLQPNIRFCANDYWMFFDHVTPIDDRAFVEGLEINGFEVLEVIPRFLPYTTKSRLPKALFLVKLYLRLRFVWRILGQQSFILGRKPPQP
ncbi:MAG: class I SAM-dependent methyltransferase [Anaerolineales bacterium]|nr:class I SAM-dependent methyltransferase [Anaerolineales bacterium]